MSVDIECISAVTFVTRNMSRSVKFYCALGFTLSHGGENADFSTFLVGSQYLNLSAENCNASIACGRIIFYVKDVDAFYRHCLDLGIAPEFEPRDALWNERYFHVLDPDGHELSFARPLSS